MNALALHQLSDRAREAIGEIQDERAANGQPAAQVAFACPGCRELEEDCACGEDGPIGVMVDL